MAKPMTRGKYKIAAAKKHRQTESARARINKARRLFRLMAGK